VQKNGGNVVSYFLTPQGRVINAVVGPAKAEKLLAEAQWAVDTYRKAGEFGGKNVFAQMQIIAQAHASLPGDPTHRLLAENALVPLPMIQQRVFEKLAGQKASPDRIAVELAAAKFAQAEQKGSPVLLVLTQAQPKPGEWDSATARLLVALNTRPTALPVRNCVLVLLPIDELPALTNLVNLSDLELADRQTPTMVLTRGDGAQIAAISQQSDPRDVARQIGEAVNRSRLTKAEKLIESGKVREATALLKLVKTSAQAGPLKDQAAARLADLQSPPAARSSKPPAILPVSSSGKEPTKTNSGALPGPRFASSGGDLNPAPTGVSPVPVQVQESGKAMPIPSAISSVGSGY